MLFAYILIPFLIFILGNIIFLNALQQALLYFNKPAKMKQWEKIAIGMIISIILIILMKTYDTTKIVSIAIAGSFVLISLFLLFIFRTLNK